MNRSTFSCWPTCASLAILMACASPRETLYSLETFPKSSPHEPPGLVIVVGPVTVPIVMDRPQLMVRKGIYKVVALEQDRWGSPLKDSIPRVLAEELNLRNLGYRFLPASSIVAGPPIGRLLIELSRLDLVWHQGVCLSAHWIYQSSDEGVSATEHDLAVSVDETQPGSEGLVDALRQALTVVSTNISAGISEQAGSKSSK